MLVILNLSGCCDGGNVGVLGEGVGCGWCHGCLHRKKAGGGLGMEGFNQPRSQALSSHGPREMKEPGNEVGVQPSHSQVRKQVYSPIFLKRNLYGLSHLVKCQRAVL